MGEVTKWKGIEVNVLEGNDKLSLVEYEGKFYKFKEWIPTNEIYAEEDNQ